MTRVYFLIGTVAELIKITPVISELNTKNIRYEIISSGQNDLSNKNLYPYFIKPPNLYLNKPPERKTAFSLLIWFIKTFVKGIFTLKKYFNDGVNNSSKILLVHGDTITTLMGSILGKIVGMKVGHIEAGLRSGSLINPFPEELDRVLTAFFSDYHFCPGELPSKNLNKIKGKVINTFYNTNIESLALVLKRFFNNYDLNIYKDDFFIFILHRQENLINNELVKLLLTIVFNESLIHKCLFIIHEPTHQKLYELGFLDQIYSNPNILVSGRLSHDEFIWALKKCLFIMTDSGGNQEECYYLGVPCLLLRNVTERSEGLGRNVLLSHNDPIRIKNFIKNYRSYSFPVITYDISPSKIIVDTLNDFLISSSY